MNKRLFILLLIICIGTFCFVGCASGGGETPAGDQPTEATIEEFIIDNRPNKTEYAYGEPFSTDGLTIKKRMSDGKEELVSLSEFTIDLGSFSNATTEGNYSIRLVSIENPSKFVTIDVTLAFRQQEGISLHSAMQVYNGDEIAISLNGVAADATVMYRTSEDEEYSAVEPTFVNAGSYTVYVKVSRVGYKDYEDSTFVIIEEVAFDVRDIEVHGYNEEYDGNAHGLTVETLPQAATITYSLDEAADAEYTAVAPTFTDSGEYRVYYRVSAPNTRDYRSYSDVVITPIALTGISAKNVVEMEGEEQSISVLGTEAGDTVTYRTSTDGAWAEAPVVVSAAGKTTVYYKVERDQNHIFTGSATITLIPDTQITGITVGSISETYTGMSYGISYSDILGLQSDDIVSYSSDNINWSSSTVSYTEPSETPYTIYVRVWRPNAGYAVESTTVTISKARYPMTITDNVSREVSMVWRQGLTLAGVAAENNLAARNLRFEEPTHSVGVGNRMVYNGIFNDNPSHYEDFPLSIYVTITPADNPEGDFIVEDVNVTYDGQPHTIEPKGAKLSEYHIVYYSDGTYTMGIGANPPSFTDAKPSSYYSIYYKATRTNYKSITAEAKVTINPAEYTGITHDDITVNYFTGMELDDIPLDADFDWSESYFTDVFPGVTTREIYYDNEPIGKYNYNRFSLNITLTINPGVLEVSANDISHAYDGQANGFGISGLNQSTDTVSYSLVGDPYEWQSDASQVFYACRNVGVHTVYYRVERENYTTVIQSATITITKASATFRVDLPSDLAYNGTNKTVTISPTCAKENCTIKYSTTEDGEYTTTVPECKLPNTYTFFVRLEADNYSFADNPRLVTFTVTKGSAYELRDADIPGITEGYTGEAFTPDTTALEAELARLGVTNYTLSYTLDEVDRTNLAASTWVSSVSFTDMCDNTRVYYLIESDLYEDRCTFFTVTIF